MMYNPDEMHKLLLMVFLSLFSGVVVAQPPMQRDFLSFQKSFARVEKAFAEKEQWLQKEFEAKGLEWPAKYMYIRSFKYDSQLEIWVKSRSTEPYKLFKSYRVCALAGDLGPKRFEGDYQVPEGFYYIDEFRPNSNYHLALGVNYPNPSDRLLSDEKKPGGAIYVHGSCVTVGCIPLTDPVIEEVYVLAALTKDQGQDFIPIHVFPIKFRNKKAAERLDKYLETHAEYKPMVDVYKLAYYYFNEKRNLPNIIIDDNGHYSLLQHYQIPVIKEPEKYVENTAKRRMPAKQRPLTEKDFYPSVYKQPEFPGGLDAFSKWIASLQNELKPLLPSEKVRAFIDVQFVVDKDGEVVNVEVSSKANNEINNLILDRFESMPKWTPAQRNEGAVAMKLIQTIEINAPPKEEVVEEAEY